jgi:iron complex outermembrane receptor protein
MIARYTFPLGSFEANAQGSLAYESSRAGDLNVVDNEIKGDIPSSTVLSLSAGLAKDSWAVELFVQNLTNEDAALGISTQCATTFTDGDIACGAQPYALRMRPRTIGIKFSQEF